MSYARRPLVSVCALALVAALASCGSSEDTGGGAGTDAPTIVVTTSILGDVVRNLVGDQAEVTVVMPPGASPHDFQASAKQAQAMRDADVLVVNGAGFEEGLASVIDAAADAGTDVYEAISAVDTLEFGAEDHAHAEGETEEEHAEGDADAAVDPHFFTDPARMQVAAQGIGDHLAKTVPALDTQGFRASVASAVAALGDLDASVEETLAPIPEATRKLVTNHEVFGYFADRYDFEVVGAVIPNLSTQAEPSVKDLEDLADLIEAEGVPAIFADASSPETLAEKLADLGAADVQVVTLFSESLGPEGSGAETYAEMMTTNAERIAAALT